MKFGADMFEPWFVGLQDRVAKGDKCLDDFQPFPSWFGRLDLGLEKGDDLFFGEVPGRRVVNLVKLGKFAKPDVGPIFLSGLGFFMRVVRAL